MQKYIQEQNRDELLDSIYRTASAMEILLLEIISTVREESVESLCEHFYSSLFENGQIIYQSIPAEVISQMEIQLNTLDTGLMKNLTLAVDRFCCSASLAPVSRSEQYRSPRNEDICGYSKELPNIVS